MKAFGVTAASLAAVMFVNTSLAYGITDNAQNAVEWHSEIGWLMLEQGKTDHVELTTKILSKDTVELTWTTDVTGKIISYQILKKTKDSDYVILETTKQTRYVDTDLESGNYYGYKVVPIFEKREPDTVTKHGIDRQNSMHYSYKKGQEMLAMQLAMQKYPKYYDRPFIEINNIKWHEFSDTDRRDDPDFQKKILEEAARAEKTLLPRTSEKT
ncbi:fibronectin type III domain-containing protein [Candidatus Nitrosotenuis chungbukensis]|uniref:fibronectin type III domain-containing protein n=1 Tax=Candidatus Nitrosotenuis chungbukensis TaxID=1353246 RepID=UPI0026719D71|nr:fibronectin type III domain-containing protein [Candidatus Nitrosotenuis chungbukensis]WKT57639.1 fibronectin type III domain-containing protein [Candidatus Nitrosotenuis chungbukensis]